MPLSILADLKRAPYSLMLTFLRLSNAGKIVR